MRSLFTILLVCGMSLTALAGFEPGDYLIQFKAHTNRTEVMNALTEMGAKVKPLAAGNWVRVQLPAATAKIFDVNEFKNHPTVAWVQPNYHLNLQNTFTMANPSYRAQVLAQLASHPMDITDLLKAPPADNQPIPPEVTSSSAGADPLYSKQWGMNEIGADKAWKVSRGTPDMIVAVIDTGVDYTHEDLQQNIWRNPGEMGKDDQGRDKSSNKVDDDSNGYVDDIIGWDFIGKDNMPYDLKATLSDILTKGGNPGHGTHCAGNVAARGDNAKGISGVAPNVKVMPLRFIGLDANGVEQGSSADAADAIHYAIKNGAKVMSNSWGSEGDDPADPQGNKVLHDAISDAEKAGVLFIAAAGNGHQGVGYDNDTDAKPGVPASYPNDNIISVAAVDVNGALGKFSNWGATTVDIGAPGVKVFSTTVDNGYNDSLIPYIANWDGTSMATPHVAGAAALYWSAHPDKTWQQVKAAILASAKPTPALAGKSVSGGRLDVDALLNRY